MNRKPAGMKLFEPFRLGPVALKNRIVMSPMVVNYATPEGYVSEQTKAYYEARAKGGAGLIIIEATSVDFSRNKCWVRQLCIDDDKYIPAFKEMVDAIHAHGTKVALQLHHGGNVSRRDLVPLPPVSPSPLSYQDSYQLYAEHGEPAAELTVSQIADVVGLYAKAARRAQKAGFDGVEIHGATGYLVGQFLSSVKNQRKDAYGGELKNRARFLFEVVAAVREAVGAGYPVWCKLSSEETGLQGGITFAETREVVRTLEGMGLYAINISGLPQVRTSYSPPGYFVAFASELKKTVKMPVIVTGGLDAELAERVLRENKADLVAIGRAFIADPEWPLKAAAGRLADIRPCIRDAYCRDCIAYEDTPVTCTVNAAVGKEKEFAIRRAEKSKRVVVVGGGPAGMEAARLATARGHRVTLFEKAPKLGGQLLLAVVPPNKELIGKYRDYLESQIRQLVVKIEVNKEASVSIIQQLAPEVVIIATGSTPSVPKNQSSCPDNVFTVEEVLTGKAKPGNSVIVVGGGTTGCETALYMAQAGKRVTVVEMLDAVAKTIMPSTIRTAMLEAMAKVGVVIMTDTRMEELVKGGLIVSDKAGNKKTLPADSVVLSTGRRPEIGLYQALQGKVPNVYLIGDAAEPGLITEAVARALQTASGI